MSPRRRALGVAIAERLAREAPVRRVRDLLGPHDVVFTQYLRPRGQTTTVWITRAPDIAQFARAVRDAGYHFDAEVLLGGEVSLTVEANRPTRFDEVPIAHEVCANNTEVPDAVDRLVRAAATKLAPELVQTIEAAARLVVPPDPTPPESLA